MRARRAFRRPYPRPGRSGLGQPSHRPGPLSRPAYDTQISQGIGFHPLCRAGHGHRTADPFAAGETGRPGPSPGHHRPGDVSQPRGGAPAGLCGVRPVRRARPPAAVQPRRGAPGARAAGPGGAAGVRRPPRAARPSGASSWFPWRGRATGGSGTGWSGAGIRSGHRRRPAARSGTWSAPTTAGWGRWASPPRRGCGTATRGSGGTATPAPRTSGSSPACRGSWCVHGCHHNTPLRFSIDLQGFFISPPLSAGGLPRTIARLHGCPLSLIPGDRPPGGRSWCPAGRSKPEPALVRVRAGPGPAAGQRRDDPGLPDPPRRSPRAPGCRPAGAGILPAPVSRRATEGSTPSRADASVSDSSPRSCRSPSR